MGQQGRRFSLEFKLQVVQEVLAGAPGAAVRALEQQVADLQRLVGKKEE